MAMGEFYPGYYVRFPCEPGILAVPDSAPLTWVVPQHPVVRDKAPTGWKCPGCGRCYGPQVAACDKCGPQE